MTMKTETTRHSAITRTVPVRLFGAFRQFGDPPVVDVPLPDRARVTDLRSGLAEHYAGNDNALSLLRASAFATDETVLDDSDPVPQGRNLSVLPPVCGG